MTPAQQAALEGVAERPLTEPEIDQIDPLLDPDNRNDVAIRDILSIDRMRPKTTTIGIGTIIGVMGEHGEDGGVFLDMLTTIGQTNRKVFWSMKLIDQGRLDLGIAETQTQMAALATALPQFAAGLASLAALGAEPDPLQVEPISAALNIAENRMTL